MTTVPEDDFAEDIDALELEEIEPLVDLDEQQDRGDE